MKAQNETIIRLLITQELALILCHKKSDLQLFKTKMIHTFNTSWSYTYTVNYYNLLHLNPWNHISSDPLVGKLALHTMAMSWEWLLRLKLAEKDFYDSGYAISVPLATDGYQSVDPSFFFHCNNKEINLHSSSYKVLVTLEQHSSMNMPVSDWYKVCNTFCKNMVIISWYNLSSYFLSSESSQVTRLVRVKVTWDLKFQKWRFSKSISSAIFQPIKKIPTVSDTRPKYLKSLRLDFWISSWLLSHVTSKFAKNRPCPIFMKLGTMLEVDKTFLTIWLSRSSEVRVKVRRWPQSPIGTILMVIFHIIIAWLVPSQSYSSLCYSVHLLAAF